MSEVRQLSPQDLGSTSQKSLYILLEEWVGKYCLWVTKCMFCAGAREVCAEWAARPGLQATATRGRAVVATCLHTLMNVQSTYNAAGT